MYEAQTPRGWVPEGLPRLTGWRWWLFITLWSLVLAVSLLASAMALVVTVRKITAPLPPPSVAGFFLKNVPDQPTIAGLIEPDGTRAGLHIGDRLIAVSGSPIGTTTGAILRQLDGRPGTRFSVTTRSPAGSSALHVLKRDPGRARRALAGGWLSPSVYQTLTVGLFYFTNDLLVLACAIVLMARRSQDRLAPWASLMMLGFVLGDSPATASLVDLVGSENAVRLAVGGLTVPLLTTTLAVFPHGRFEPRWSLLIALASLPITSLLLVPNHSVDFAFNGGFAALQCGAVAAIVSRYRKMPPDAGRQQIRWALLGFGFSIASLVLLTAIGLATVQATDYTAWSWLNLGQYVFLAGFSIPVMIGITVALLRYRLYDADTAISRSIIYGALTLSLLAIFAGAEKMVEILGEQYFGEGLGALAGGLAAAVAAVMIAPIHHRVSHWAEHRFRSGLVLLRRGLPLLVGDMRETASPKALADAMLVRVERGVRARHGAVVIGGDVLDARDVEPGVVRTWLETTELPAERFDRLSCVRRDPLFPLRMPLHADGTGLVGWLLLGPRPDGTFFGREDRAALHDIADPVARALGIAIRREQREAIQAERERALSQRMDALHQFVVEQVSRAQEATVRGGTSG